MPKLAAHAGLLSANLALVEGPFTAGVGGHESAYVGATLVVSAEAANQPHSITISVIFVDSLFSCR
jgi:hypothetical protein